MTIAINHHKNPVITRFDENTVERLNTGVVYTYGHDRGFRPIVVIRIDRINLEESFELLWNTYYYFMLVIYHYRMVPYHAEKVNLIIDFGNRPLSQIPVFQFYEESKKVGICYSSITERTVIANASSLGWLWKLISSFLTASQKKKLVMVEPEKQHNLLEYVDPDQL